MQVFQFRIDQENRADGMFVQDLIPQMFSNVLVSSSSRMWLEELLG